MAYTRINWQDGESGGTPLSAENLNKMDEGIYNNSINIENLGKYRMTFEIPSSSSKTLTFSGSELAFLFAGKTTLGTGNEFWYVGTYNEGTPSRTQISKLYSGSNQISYEIDGKKLILTNTTTNRYKCSIIILIGVSEDITIN